MAKNVKITLDGKDDTINVSSFLAIIRASVHLLNKLGDNPIVWAIGEVSHSSPLNIEIFSKDDSAIDRVNAFMSGMSALEEGKVQPSHFDDDALQAARKIVKPLNDGITKLIFTTDGMPPLKASNSIAASIDKFERKIYYAYTDLDGELGQITAHKGKSNFCIYDPLTDKPTTCKFNYDDADKIGQYITHRIRVYGKAKYDKNHNPVEIKVEGWEVIGKPTPISKLHDAKFKLNGDSVGLIRSLRDLDA